MQKPYRMPGMFGVLYYFERSQALGDIALYDGTLGWGDAVRVARRFATTMTEQDSKISLAGLDDRIPSGDIYFLALCDWKGRKKGNILKHGRAYEEYDIVADSWLQFLQRHCTDLENGKYGLKHKPSIMRL
jgi:cell wall assembly regulator SMI1